MQAFAVVIALLAVAAVGWLLSRWARDTLRRHGVPTDERDVPDVSRPVWREESGGAVDDAGAAESRDESPQRLT